MCAKYFENVIPGPLTKKVLNIGQINPEIFELLPFIYSFKYFPQKKMSEVFFVVKLL